MEKLIDACARGDPTRVLRLIELDITAVNPSESGIDTPLHAAAGGGHLDVLELLLSSGADVSASANDDSQPLHYAARNGHVQICEALLEAGSRVSTRNKGGLTPLHKATQNGHAQCAEILLDAGAEIDAWGAHDIGTPLQIAAQKGDVKMVAILLAAGADPRVKRDSDGQNAIELASTNSVRSLLEAPVSGKGITETATRYPQSLPLLVRHIGLSAGSTGRKSNPYTEAAQTAAIAAAFDMLDKKQRKQHSSTFAALLASTSKEHTTERSEVILAFGTLGRLGVKAPDEQGEYVATLLSDDTSITSDALASLIATSGYFSVNTGIDNFVAMGDRVILAQYRKALDANEDPRTGRALARQFLNAQVDAAKEYPEALREVYAAKKDEHKPAYALALHSIEQQPEFKDYIQYATMAARTANNIHGSHPTQLTTRIDELYNSAEGVKGRFLNFVETLSNKTRGKLNVKIAEVEKVKKGGFFKKSTLTNQIDTHVRLVLKSQERVLEKTGLIADRNKLWDCSGVCDVVRAGLEYGQVSELLQVLLLLLACDNGQKSPLKATSLGDGAESITIVRVKDRFTKPTCGGWADTMVNFYFADDTNKHIVELQLTHSLLMTVRTAQNAHMGYNMFRTAQELLEAAGESIDDEIEDDKSVSAQANWGRAIEEVNNNMLHPEKARILESEIRRLEQTTAEQLQMIQRVKASHSAQKITLKKQATKINLLEAAVAGHQQFAEEQDRRIVVQQAEIDNIKSKLSAILAQCQPNSFEGSWNDAFKGAANVCDSTVAAQSANGPPAIRPALHLYQNNDDARAAEQVESSSAVKMPVERQMSRTNRYINIPDKLTVNDSSNN